MIWMPARCGDWKSRGFVEVTRFHRSAWRYAEKTCGASNPLLARCFQLDSGKTWASGSRSQSTERCSPWASSSKQERSTSVCSHEGSRAGATASTKYRRLRTFTTSPGDGREYNLSGSGLEADTDLPIIYSNIPRLTSQFRRPKGHDFVVLMAHSTGQPPTIMNVPRSEEHTSELQSLRHLVCRLLL